jgi:hypothetical protein
VIRTVSVWLALALALVAFGASCKNKDAPTGPVAPLPDGSGSGSETAPPPSDPTPPPAKLSDAELDALMHDAVALFQALGVAAAAANGDCAKMAAAIDQVVADHADFMQRAHAIDDDPDTEDRGDAWMKAHEAEVKPVFTRFFDELTKCQGDPAVEAAVEKLSS